MNEDQKERIMLLTRNTRSLGELTCIAAKHAEEIKNEVNSIVEEKFIIDVLIMLIQDRTTLQYLERNYVMLPKK